MSEDYDLVNTAKTKFPKSELMLSGVLRRRGLSWRRIGELNGRLNWVAKTLEFTLLDPKTGSIIVTSVRMAST
jgi:hypothetical protein